MVDSRSGFLRSTYLVELFVCITDRFRPKEPSKNTLDREKITVEDIKSAQSGSEIKQKSMASSCENRQENSGMITSNWAIGRSQRPRGKIDDSLQPEKPFRSNCRSEVATVPARGIDNASVKSAGTDSTVCRPEYQQKTQNQDKDARNRSPEANGKVLLQTLPSGYKVARFMVRGCKFEIDSIYAPIKPIGKGAYGIVCSAQNTQTGERVALKKIRNSFDNIIDAKRTLREIKLLRHLDHENIIGILDIVKPVSWESFRDVYYVSELMDTDLHQILRSSQKLSDDHVKYFVYQLLRGLKYMHSANILHRDLKPANLLLMANCDLKICDFGLATSTQKESMTEYVVTRWYRAPELLLSCSDYTSAIDVWSVGCIFAEVLRRKPLFPGKDYVHQLNLIVSTIGSPSPEDLQFIKSDKAKRYIRSLPSHPRIEFYKYFEGSNPLAVDLVDKMLVFDPTKRITVEAALEHPYLASLHDINDEPVCHQPFDMEFENAVKDEGVAKRLVYDEMLNFHPEAIQEHAIMHEILRENFRSREGTSKHIH